MNEMPSTQSTPIVRIAPNNPVFDLPVIVGIEAGLFAKAGLDVHFSASYADREKDSADRPIMSRLKEQLFDCGSAVALAVLKKLRREKLRNILAHVSSQHGTRRRADLGYLFDAHFDSSATIFSDNPNVENLTTSDGFLNID
jgi:hypothetical protein